MARRRPVSGLGSLTAGAVRLLDYLAAERGRLWVRRWVAAGDCMMCDRSAFRAVKGLSMFGLVEIEHRDRIVWIRATPLGIELMAARYRTEAA